MARDAIAFIAALDLEQVDLLGFSIGSFVAQEIALHRPRLVRRLILASSAPQGGTGMHGWAPDVLAAVGAPHPNPDGYLGVFYTRSDTSRNAGSNPCSGSSPPGQRTGMRFSRAAIRQARRQLPNSSRKRAAMRATGGESHSLAAGQYPNLLSSSRQRIKQL